MGKKRATSPRRLAETLIEIHPNLFVIDFETNKKIVGEKTKLGKVVRNMVAGYITRLKKLES